MTEIHEFVDYHRYNRPHNSREKDAPRRRAVDVRPDAGGVVIGLKLVVGLHHRYAWHSAD
jgi:hypothetical protein